VELENLVMAQLEVKAHVDAPPEVVFEVLSDFAHAAENIRGIERLEILTDGPVGVGTRFRETRVMFGKESTEEMEITAFDPPHGYTVGADSCGCRYCAEYRLVADIAGTHVRLLISTQPITLTAKLMSPLSFLMSGSMKMLIAADLEDVKRIAEAKEAFSN
jgi:carbon monoxide dehydrogenase subunit G